MRDIAVGDIVTAFRRKWAVVELAGSLAIIANDYDVRVVPIERVKRSS